MKRATIGILTILFCTNLFSQEIRFSKNKIVFAYSEFTSELADTVTLYNDDNFGLIIDSIYSVNHYGYKLNAVLNDTSIGYYITAGVDSVELNIGPKDSAKLVFSDPSLCPICKRMQKPDAFTDTILIHSDSKSNNYSYLEVEGIGYVAIEGLKTVVNDYSLNQNYPNPFNPSTIINYSVPKESFVKIKVFDLLGREVKTLINENKTAGNYSVNFNAKNLSSGIYFYTIKAGSFVQTKKMVLLK
jgi:Secretion system C-terminal sorting domain